MNEPVRKGYYLREFELLNPRHGGIGNKDAETIMGKMGLKEISFPFKSSRSFAAKILRLNYLLKTLLTIKKNCYVIFQFPLYSGMSKLLLYALKKRKHIKLVCFIADIDGLKDGNQKVLEKEKKMYLFFQSFIVHNQAMHGWVSEINPKALFAEIEFFDFLATPVQAERKINYDIVFAGNLAKSKFIDELHLVSEKDHLHFTLYGEGVNKKALSEGVIYKGVEDPYELPGKIEGSFGLVWEGDSVYDLKGALGNYVQYISNHKLSLYIISGLPIIAPANSGSANLVIKYGIGIVVNNLFEIKNRIDHLTAEEYKNMIKNMESLSKKISSGNCLRSAIEKIEKELEFL